jgi:predicted small lipoprotein YifL
MKKLLLVLAALLTLAACGQKEKVSLEEALLTSLKNDQDLKDYNLDPQEVADCTLEAISDSLPVMPTDPRRAQYFEAYALFLSAPSSPQDAHKMIEGQKELFGSVQAARQAAMSVTDHIMTCMGLLIAARDTEGQNGPAQHPRDDAAAAPAPDAAPQQPAAN